MKKILLLSTVSLMLLESGCASLVGEGGLSDSQITAQHHKPLKGEPKRRVRDGAVICDVIFSGIIFAPAFLGIDFLTGDIYRPPHNDIAPPVKNNDSLLSYRPVANQEKEVVLISAIPLTHDDSLCHEIKDSIQNGLDQYVKISFNTSYETLYEIKNSQSYTLDKQKYKDDISLHTFLHYKIVMAGFNTKLKCKNETSFSVPANSKGMIFFVDGKMTINFPFQAQNGYGNMIYAQSYSDDSGTLIDDGNNHSDQ